MADAAFDAPGVAAVSGWPELRLLPPGKRAPGQMALGQLPQSQLPQGQVSEAQVSEVQVSQGQISHGQIREGQNSEGQVDANAVALPRFELFTSDAVEWLSGLADESVDSIVTDPPYESLEKHRAIGTTTRLKHSKASSNDWFPIFPNARFEELFCQLYRVLRKDRHFYLFCDAETMFVAKPIAERVGFRFWKPLVWDKRKIGMGYHYRARCEFILFFEKGKRRLNDLGQADVIECPSIRGGYPTEKPVAVSEILVRQSTQRGELVIDPFMGSGSVGVAAASQARNFLGNDINPAAVDLAASRLAGSAERAPLAAALRPRQGVLL